MAEKTTIATLKRFKKQGRPIAVLTCYDYGTAVLLQESQIDSILVGDSLAQVVLGHSNTLAASMDIMIALTAAVRRGAPQVYLVGDMPFLSYQVGPEKAILNAGRFLVEAGCDAVKMEVDRRDLELVAKLSAAGIAVMAHMGLRPSMVHQSGEFRAQATTAEQAAQLVADALAMVEAGVCSFLLECVPDVVGAAVAQRTDLPVISCGSGPGCDGQVLVLHDVLGLPGAGSARFAKRYAQIGDQMRSAFDEYVGEVRQRQFPDEQHSYHMSAEQRQEFEKMLGDSRGDR